MDFQPTSRRMFSAKSCRRSWLQRADHCILERPQDPQHHQQGIPPMPWPCHHEADGVGIKRNPSCETKAEMESVVWDEFTSIFSSHQENGGLLPAGVAQSRQRPDRIADPSAA